MNKNIIFYALCFFSISTSFDLKASIEEMVGIVLNTNSTPEQKTKAIIDEASSNQNFVYEFRGYLGGKAQELGKDSLVTIYVSLIHVVTQKPLTSTLGKRKTGAFDSGAAEYRVHQAAIQMQQPLVNALSLEELLAHFELIDFSDSAQKQPSKPRLLTLSNITTPPRPTCPAEARPPKRPLVDPEPPQAPDELVDLIGAAPSSGPAKGRNTVRSRTARTPRRGLGFRTESKETPSSSFHHSQNPYDP